MNRRTLKTEKLLSSSPCRKSALINWFAGIVYKLVCRNSDNSLNYVVIFEQERKAESYLRLACSPENFCELILRIWLADLQSKPLGFLANFQGLLRARPPGLIQHLLTVLVLSFSAAPAPASTFVWEPHIVPLG